jgi:hypothetical protein
MERWQAVIAGKWEQAYSFATPAYRKAYDIFGFRADIPGLIKYRDAKVLSVTCKEAVCDVKVRLDVSPVQKSLPDFSTDIDERWLLESGQWWRYQGR